MYQELFQYLYCKNCLIKYENFVVIRHSHMYLQLNQKKYILFLHWVDSLFGIYYFSASAQIVAEQSPNNLHNLIELSNQQFTYVPRDRLYSTRL